ncbi:hypothetical protein [Halomonas salinarum]|uniref:hypothetical protein n=1 Tax=Halomonas salinarum TaxID=1158993 RepID=UPI001439FB44|nr:hypothetical protein [Halomonas salinarum]
MHVRDSGTLTKTALVVTLMLGGGLAVAPVNDDLRDADSALTSPTVSAHNMQGVIVASASGHGEGDAPWAPALGREGTDYDRVPPTSNGSASIIMERAGCTRECLESLRQRLLDNHRQIAPVWVF